MIKRHPYPEIYCDLNAQMIEQGYSLERFGSVRDLKKLGLTLETAVGMRFTFVMDDGDEEGKPDDIMFNGVVRHDPHWGFLAIADDDAFIGDHRSPSKAPLQTIDRVWPLEEVARWSGGGHAAKVGLRPEADTARVKEGEDLIFRERPAFFPFGLMLMLGFGGYFAFAISIPAIYGNYHAAMDFTVEDSYQACEQPLNNRCETHYVVRKSDGSKGDFVPVPYQFESGVLEADTQIRKGTGSFTYEVDGVRQEWPYLWRCAAAGFIGVLGVIVSLGFFLRRFFSPHD